MKRVGAMVLVAIGTLVWFGPAQVLATPVAVGNASFEAGSLNGGALPPVYGNYYNSILDDSSSPAWQNDDGANWDVTLFGDSVMASGSGDEPLMHNTTMKDGHKCALINGRNIWQQLSAVLTAGEIYTLSVEVGRRGNSVFSFSGYDVALVVGTLTASGKPTGTEGTDWFYLAKNTSSTVPDIGYWLNAPVEVSGTVTPAMVGKPVNVILKGSGTGVLFDDVKVNVVPEPVSLVLLGLGGLLLCRRK